LIYLFFFGCMHFWFICISRRVDTKMFCNLIDLKITLHNWLIQVSKSAYSQKIQINQKCIQPKKQQINQKCIQPKNNCLDVGLIKQQINGQTYLTTIRCYFLKSQKHFLNTLRQLTCIFILKKSKNK
jgi:hypothetical protein